MTSDDILSMLKAADRVISDMQIMIDGEEFNPLVDSIHTLATIQRDILKSIIE